MTYQCISDRYAQMTETYNTSEAEKARVNEAYQKGYADGISWQDFAPDDSLPHTPYITGFYDGQRHRS